MSEYQEKEGTVTVFINSKKQKAAQPDFTGGVRHRGQRLPIALWKTKNASVIKGKLTTSLEDDFSKRTQVDLLIKVNDFKKTENHPDRVGTVEIDGIKYSVGLFEQTSGKGVKYLKGSIREAKEKSVAPVSESSSLFDF